MKKNAKSKKKVCVKPEDLKNVQIVYIDPIKEYEELKKKGIFL